MSIHNYKIYGLIHTHKRPVPCYTYCMSKYKTFLFLVFAGVWIWAAINPVYRHDWLLENYLVFIFVPIILIIGRYLKLSNVSYTLITIFMCLHVIGSHYTYAEVPFGYTLQDWF